MDFIIAFSLACLIPQVVNSTVSGCHAPWGPGIGSVAKEGGDVNERGGRTLGQPQGEWEAADLAVH